MSAYEILAVRIGTVHSTKNELFHRYGAYGEADMPADLDFFFYILSDGQATILVDTGFRPPAAVQRGRECLCPPREALARLGIDPAGVSAVVVSHFHWDHIGNVGLFAAAELFLPERELAFWAGPLARHVQFSAHIDADAVGEVQEAWRAGRAVATGRDQLIAPGLRAITVGGHSPGQQVLVVDTATGPVILASDAVHLYEELELERPFAIIADLAEMYEAYALLKRLREESGATVVPGHDPLVPSRFPELDGDAAGLAFRIA
jgi:glyoxylase-like metal-dependent hydrolase (beta-lactamase superfamily II)